MSFLQKLEIGCRDSTHSIRVSVSLQLTDVFRILKSANSAQQDQQLAAVLAERFFELVDQTRFRSAKLSDGVLQGLPENWD